MTRKIDISDETAENLRKEFGEYQFKHGDIVDYGGMKRIIFGKGKNVAAYDFEGDLVCNNQKSFANNGYKKVGNVFND